ncbi:uncharacterized protein LOC122082891 [Macadamia integrifolia]|uniref:uncharacterized protein LOC122082891 n=1 Tax=Macadamia integrifolia TaxID=60698 RepID=UPI001C4E83B0|nr:uncharacterized protein LOC122082891 [Macadamia integrifolia]XP_042506637.1 uncharacterized protein LOC122082891 [Macadamia integrifolia]
MIVTGEEDSLECPICWESFNLVENVPHVLWCGHSLCKTCLLSLQPAEIKFPILSIHIPVLLSCPWCQLLCFKLVWKGDLRFPRKNFFLLWLVETATGYRTTNCPSSSSKDQKFLQPLTTDLVTQGGCLSPPSEEHLHEHSQGFLDARQTMNHLQSSLQRSFSSLVQLTVKLPIVFIVMLFLSYVIIGSIVVLVFYLLITFIFAVPSLWLLCFFQPMLERLARDAIA